MDADLPSSRRATQPPAVPTSRRQRQSRQTSLETSRATACRKGDAAGTAGSSIKLKNLTVAKNGDQFMLEEWDRLETAANILCGRSVRARVDELHWSACAESETPRAWSSSLRHP